MINYSLSFAVPDANVNPLVVLAIALVFLLAALLLFDYFCVFVGFPFILSFVGEVVGNVFVEHGTYLIQQGVQPYPTGSTARLLLPWLIFLSVFFYLISYFSKIVSWKLYCENKIYWLLILFTGFVLLLTLYFGFIFKGVPLLEGFSRVAYRTGHPLPVVKFQIYFGFLITGLGMVYVSALCSNSVWIARLAFLLLFLFVVYMVLQGSKFTGIWSAIYLFYLPYIFYLYKRGRRLSLSFFMVPLILIFFLLTYVIVYYTITGHDGFDFFISRLAMQGEVWWSTDSEVMQNPEVGHGQWLREIKYILFGGDETEVGLKRLMYLIAPTDLVDRYLLLNVTFTAGYPSIALLMFGNFGLLAFQLFAGLCAALVACLLVFFVAKRKMIEAIIISKVYWTATSAFSMGYLYVLFSLKSLVYTGVAVLLFFLVRALRNLKLSERTRPISH